MENSYKNSKFNKIENKQEIVDDYKKSKSLGRTSSRFGISPGLLKKILKEYNVDINWSTNFISLNEEELTKYYSEVRDLALVAQKFQVSITKVRTVLLSHNIEIKKITIAEDSNKIKLVCDSYKKHGTIKEVVADLKIHKNAVSQILKNEGLLSKDNLKRVAVGDRFNKLLLIEKIEPFIHPKTNIPDPQFICKCDCGNTVIVKSSTLRRSQKKSCGCLMKARSENAEIKRKEQEIKRQERLRKKEERLEKQRLKREKNPINKFVLNIGDRIGRLVILGIDGVTDRTNIMSTDRLITQCDCGKIKSIAKESLRKTRSCGCIAREGIRAASTTHNLASKNNPHMKKWYDRWRSMIKRCYNPKCIRYPDYGGRGIKVCDRWLEPNGVGCLNYYNDIHQILGPQPSDKHSLDRIDNDSMYQIENMRWATISEQNKNKRYPKKSNNK